VSEAENHSEQALKRQRDQLLQQLKSYQVAKEYHLEHGETEEVAACDQGIARTEFNLATTEFNLGTTELRQENFEGARDRYVSSITHRRAAREYYDQHLKPHLSLRLLRNCETSIRYGEGESRTRTGKDDQW